MDQRVGKVTSREAARRARARLEAVGRAYIDFARSEPGWFRTAFTPARSQTPQPQIQGVAGKWSARSEGQLSVDRSDPYALLGERLDELVAAGVLAPEHRPGAEFAAWSAVHGFACLLLDGPLRDLNEAETDNAIDTILALVHRGLR